MGLESLRRQLGHFLEFRIPEEPVTFSIHHVAEEPGYRRLHVSYADMDGEPIPAFLLLPAGEGPFAAVLVHRYRRQVMRPRRMQVESLQPHKKCAHQAVLQCGSNIGAM